MTPRMTYPTVLVLYAVAHGYAYGFDIIDATGLGSGTVYPILRRLERARMLTARAERAREAHADGRPPRRYYTVTGTGADALRTALERHPGVAAIFGGAPRRAPRPGIA